MSKPIEDGGPAFPLPNRIVYSESHVSVEERNSMRDSGMSLRTYAAIKLRVPESGIDWLDDMIRKSLRDSFAANVLPSYLEEASDYVTLQRVGAASYETADAALKARKGDA